LEVDVLAPITHILGLTTIVRERMLPVSGKTVVRLNQKVSATEVVAEAEYAREHVLIDVSRNLGISQDAADQLIRCKVEDRLSQDMVVAQSKGVMPRTVRVPRDGKVVAVGGGQVLMEVGETRLELHAGIPGMVVNIIPDRGVVIQTVGALIQGVWGNGHADTGMMLPLAEGPDTVLTPNQMDVSLRGSIILGCICQDPDTLRTAAELPVRGLILASMSPALIPLALQVRFPIVVLDGFGMQPMNSAAYKLLITNAKREVTLSAEHYDRYSGNRPEVIIPLPVTDQPAEPRNIEAFAPNQQVRVRRSPYAGVFGTLVDLKPGLTTLPSGLRALAADVKLENGELIVVPLVNLEVVG
jgi:hypothetical protein